MEKEITYGLSRCYYAPYSGGQYAAPSPLNGAVKISLAPEVFDLSFIGLDCMPHDEKQIIYGYKGSLEIASLQSLLLSPVYGMGEYEKVSFALSGCAIMFETDGSPKMRHCYYNCTLGRPEFVSETTTDSVTVSIFSVPLLIRAAEGGNIKRIILDDNLSAWHSFFEAVR